MASITQVRGYRLVLITYIEKCSVTTASLKHKTNRPLPYKAFDTVCPSATERIQGIRGILAYAREG